MTRTHVNTTKNICGGNKNQSKNNKKKKKGAGILIKLSFVSFSILTIQISAYTFSPTPELLSRVVFLFLYFHLGGDDFRPAAVTTRCLNTDDIHLNIH